MKQNKWPGADLVPHRPPMLFIDSVRLHGDRLTAFTTVKADWIIIDESATISGAAFFELMAQGYAAVRAAEAKNTAAEAGGPRMGFLVGVKNFQVCAPAGIGQELRIEIESRSDIGPFSVFAAQIKSGDNFVHACGQIKVFLLDEQELLSGTIAGPLAGMAR